MASPSYIADHDMVLAVSFETIYNQLQKLWDTPCPGQAQNANPQQYLIPHQLSFLSQDAMAELNASIAKVTVVPSFGQEALPNTVQMNFWIQGYSYSTFTYYTLEKQPSGPAVPQAHTTRIDDWTFSFQCDIGKSDITSINQNAVHPDTYNRLLPYVESKSLTVAALFCSFDSALFTKTFTLSLSGNTQADPVIQQKMTVVLQNYFNAYNQTPAVAGSNPYVLGYGVYSPKNRDPISMIPVSVSVSTTSNGPEYGQLNYLWDLPQDDLDPNDSSASVIDTSFYTVTNSQNHDGILALSSRMVHQRWIGLKVGPIFLPPMQITNLASSNPSGSISPTTMMERLDMTQNWQDFFGIIGNGQGRQECSSAVTIMRLSDNYPDPTTLPTDDTKRKMMLDVEMNWDLWVHTQLQSLGSTVWSDEEKAHMTPSAHYRYNVTIAPSGRWIITPDSTVTQLPALDAQGNLLYNLDGSNQGVKVDVTYLDGSHLLQPFCKQQLDNLAALVGAKLRQINATPVGSPVDIETCLQNLQKFIIMPAGDIFSYVGMDTDALGHLYTHFDLVTTSAS